MTPSRPHAVRLSILTVTLALMGLMTAGAWAFPKPAIVNPSWSFDLKVDKPDAVSVEDPRGNVRWFWYLPYQVTNQTGKDRLFLPEITVVDDNGRIVQAGKNVPSRVFPKVKQRLNNSLLLSPIEVVGKLLQGEDYAKQSVAIWPASDKDVDQFSVLFGGVHGETQTIKDPETGEEQILRRTVMLRYKTPGSPSSPQNQPIERIERRDVMR